MNTQESIPTNQDIKRLTEEQEFNITLKWRELDEDVWYAIEGKKMVKTEFGERQILTLSEGKGENAIEVWSPPRLTTELSKRNPQGANKYVYVCSLGLKPKVSNPNQSYFKFLLY